MKIRIVTEISSKNEESIEDLMEVVNYIRSGKFQRDMEMNNTSIKSSRCKATVEILEEE